MPGWGVQVVENPRLQGILRADYKKLFSDLLNAIALLVDDIIKTPGFCPVDTGRLRGGHSVKLANGLTKYITNAVYYWIWIVLGHRVLGIQTDQQRKWYFATHDTSYYNPVIGTKAKYVPPNNYLLKAILEAFQGGHVASIIQSRLREFLQSGGR